LPFVSLLSFLYYNIFCQKNQPLLYQYNCYYEKFSDGTIKNIQDEIPFDLPNGWSWCRLKCICPYGECDNVECSEIKNDDWILDLEDIEKDSGKILAFAKKSDKNSISTKHKFYQGQLLYSKLRPYLNKVVIAPKAGYCTSEILPLLFWGDIDVHYMQMYLMSNVFLSYTDKISYGVKMPRLGTADGKQALIALPPNNEQKLIAKTFQDILPALETIKTEQCALEDIINLLKSKVLELAIQGKLVPQDENDEPAGVLLERIRAERKAKLGKKYVESYIFKGDDNCYYEHINGKDVDITEELLIDIPDNWQWRRIENLFFVTKLAGFEYTNYFTKSAIAQTNEVPIVRAQNVKMNKFIENTQEFISLELSELLTRSSLTKDCLLMTFIGAGIGDTCLYSTPKRHHLAPNVAKLEPYSKEINLRYCLYWLMSPVGQQCVSNIKKMTAQPSLSMETIRSIFIAVPPFAEQKRIVEKIDGIFAKL
jgi:putative type I restriction enzyme specificity protein